MTVWQCPVEVVALEELLDGPEVEVAWLVEHAVDDFVAICVNELCLVEASLKLP